MFSCGFSSCRFAEPKEEGRLFSRHQQDRQFEFTSLFLKPWAWLVLAFPQNLALHLYLFLGGRLYEVPPRWQSTHSRYTRWSILPLSTSISKPASRHSTAALLKHPWASERSLCTVLEQRGQSPRDRKGQGPVRKKRGRVGVVIGSNYLCIISISVCVQLLPQNSVVIRKISYCEFFVHSAISGWNVTGNLACKFALKVLKFC